MLQSNDHIMTECVIHNNIASVETNNHRAMKFPQPLISGEN